MVMVPKKDGSLKTSFSTKFGSFQFKVLPFGIVTGQSESQRLTDDTLKGAEEYSDGQIDDIVIFSNSWEDHINHVFDILTRIGKAGLTVKARKCAFGMIEIYYLGRIVGNGLTKMEPEKIEAVKNFPRPT